MDLQHCSHLSDLKDTGERQVPYILQESLLSWFGIS